jgi:hypothetical protein
MEAMVFTKISVLIPTRQRLARLATMLDSFEQTTSGRADLVFRVDDDDVATQEYLRDDARAHWRMVVGPRLGYANLPKMYNELYQWSNGDVLMVGNDDMIFKTPNWDRIILDEARKYPDGLFDFGVMTHNYLNFPFATISRKMADTVGCFFDPRFFWGDIFWRDVASRFARAIPLHSVEIEHDWVGFRPDRVFIAGEGTRRADHSQYHSVAVEEAVAKLEALWCMSASRS